MHLGQAASYAGVDEEFVRSLDDGTLLTLRVSPCARRSSVEGAYGRHALKPNISAPPVDAEANAGLERLAEVFGLTRSKVPVVKGQSGRDKAALLKGGEPGEAARILGGWIGQGRYRCR